MAVTAVSRDASSIVVLNAKLSELDRVKFAYPSTGTDIPEGYFIVDDGAGTAALAGTASETVFISFLDSDHLSVSDVVKNNFDRSASPLTVRMSSGGLAGINAYGIIVGLPLSLWATTPAVNDFVRSGTDGRPTPVTSPSAGAIFHGKVFKIVDDVAYFRYTPGLKVWA